MKPEALQASIKSALPMIEWNKAVNSPLWAMCKAEASKYNAEHKLAIADAVAAVKVEKAKVESNRPVKRLTEDERADAIEALYDAKVIDQTISAAEVAQYKDLLNLKQRDRDVVINIVKYAEMKNGE